VSAVSEEEPVFSTCGRTRSISRRYNRRLVRGSAEA